MLTQTWKERWQARMQAWQQRRLPPTLQVRLSQRQIFIFLTREGGLLFLMMAAIFVAGINYANNLVLGLCFFLGSVLIITIHYTFNNLSGLVLEAIDATDSEAGGHTAYRIRLTPPGRKQPCQIRLEWDGMVQQIVLLDQPMLVTFRLATPRRGRYIPARLTVSTVFPLGILRAWTYVRFSQAAWVAPAPVETVLRGVDTASLEEADSVMQVAGQDEFDELRGWITGEPLSRISWGHVARGQGLLTKQFVDQRGQAQILDYEMMPGGHERKLSGLAYWVKRLTVEQMAFELRVQGRILPRGQGILHQQQALRLLAEVP